MNKSLDELIAQFKENVASFNKAALECQQAQDAFFKAVRKRNAAADVLRSMELADKEGI